MYDDADAKGRGKCARLCVVTHVLLLFVRDMPCRGPMSLLL
jgi:hypothetical protein